MSGRRSSRRVSAARTAASAATEESVESGTTQPEEMPHTVEEEEAVPLLPTSTPLRRTRSQTAAAAAAVVATPEDSFHTPVRRARGAASASTPPSPSLRDLTSAALESSFTAMKQSCTRYQLLAFDHCPEWLRDNRYITGGYRANIGWRQSCESVCHLHNETVNVWSHLIAFLVMTMLLIATMAVLSPHGVDRMDLDVVLSSRPLCDIEGQKNPLCNLEVSTPATPTVAAENSSTEDPLELLHQILGDQQDEMLIELLSRVQTHVPNLQLLTQTLKEKASSLQESLYAAVPVDATRHLQQLKDDTGLNFGEYVAKMEGKLATLKTMVGAMLTPSSETSLKAQAASLRVHTEFVKLKETLSEFARDFSPDLLHFTSPRDMDVIKVTQNLLSNFLEQAHWARRGFTLSPTVVAMAGVQVRVKSIVEGMHLGSGSIFGLGLSDAMDDLASQAAPHEDSRSVNDLMESRLLDKHEHVTTTLDADGRGKTTSTAIGYMTVEAHTRSAQPGLVQLQLHSYLPRYPLAIFIITAMMCLFFSSSYHLMHAVSDEWARRFQALDYAGIVLLIAGSTHPIIYYGFYCSPMLKWLYIGIVWTLALIVFFIVVLPAYRASRFRSLKTLCFIALGFSGCIPLMHFNYLLGHVHFILYWLLVMGACYLTGAAIYIFQVPERWWPGYFNYFFSSHQLWHLSIFAAVLVHYAGLLHHYEWRMTRVCTQGMWS